MANIDTSKFTFFKKTVNNKAVFFELVEDAYEGELEYEFVAKDEFGYACFFSYDHFNEFMHTEQDIEETKQRILDLDLRLVYEAKTIEHDDGLHHFYKSKLVNADDNSSTYFGPLTESKEIATTAFIKFLLG